MQPGESRDLWHLIETVHAITYFEPGCRQARLDVGFKGFWMGYFASRAAPLGEVGPGAVEAIFGGFEPAMVLKALPDAWDCAKPQKALDARAEAAAAAIREAASAAGIDDCEDHAAGLLDPLDRVIEAADPLARPLFAANRTLMYDDPVADLWQMCTSLREHRGDGHVSVLAVEGFGTCEAHVLAAAANAVEPAVLRDNRGWSEMDWTDAEGTLRAAGVIETGALTLTERGRKLHDHIETRTDELAAPPYAGIGESGRDVIRDGLIPFAAAVAEAAWIPFPNPIGLPEVV
ncbi:MAG: SCO6745 family protein [Microthrixaceae bacterium]